MNEETKWKFGAGAAGIGTLAALPLYLKYKYGRSWEAIQDDMPTILVIAAIIAIIAPIVATKYKAS